MKNSLKLVSALLLGSIAGTASADPIVGDLGLVLFNGSVNVDTTANTLDFSAGNNSLVNIATNDYAGLILNVAQYFDFTYNPFAEQVIFSGATFSFKLSTIVSEIESAGTGVTLTGVGTMSLAGFDDTVGSWSFSADKNAQTSLFNLS
jgi:hypothetical protein